MLSILNLGDPDAEAVKRSPTPSLLTPKAANEVLAETDAPKVVPLNADCPVTLKFAEDVACPPNKESKVELYGAIAPLNVNS